MARHTGNNWTSYSERTLLTMVASGYSYNEISITLQRSVKSIERKMYALKHRMVRNILNKSSKDFAIDIVS